MLAATRYLLSVSLHDLRTKKMLMAEFSLKSMQNKQEGLYYKLKKLITGLPHISSPMIYSSFPLCSEMINAFADIFWSN